MARLKQGLLFLGVAAFALTAGFLLRSQLIGDTQQTSLSSAASKQGAEAILAANLPDIHGENQAIAQWQGQVLVVNFWATWCAPCREEIPEFIEMQEKFHDQGLLFIGIAIDREEKVVAYSKEFGINYPVLVGGMDAMSLAEAAGNHQSALPFTVIINHNGEMMTTYLGRVDQKKLEKTLIPLLQDRSQSKHQALL